MFKGTEHMVLSNEDFYNDDIMGDKLEDYEILQIKQKDISPKCRIIKVLSKLNSKIYAIRVMDQNLIEQGNINKNLQELEMLKKVNHPNVAKFFKFFKQGEKYNSSLTPSISITGSVQRPFNIITLVLETS